MPVAPIGGDGGDGVAFLVSAGIVFEIIAAACSSPQTTEINADTRADTLMKWVHLGLGGSALFVGLAMAFEPQRKKPIFLGGALAAGLMYGGYWHAKIAGLASSMPGTEGQPGRGGRGMRWGM